MTDDEEIDDGNYSDTRWGDSTPTVDDGEMTEREAEIIEERIDEIEDEDKHYTTEEAAEELGIDLDRDSHRRRFAVAVGMVACGWESLPEAAERRDVDPADVARALSRHQFPEDYSGRRWAERHRDDAEIAADRAEKLDDEENVEDIDALIDDLPNVDGIGRYDPEEVTEINPDPDELAGDGNEE